MDYSDDRSQEERNSDGKSREAARLQREFRDREFTIPGTRNYRPFQLGTGVPADGARQGSPMDGNLQGHKEPFFRTEGGPFWKNQIMTGDMDGVPDIWNVRDEWSVPMCRNARRTACESTKDYAQRALSRLQEYERLHMECIHHYGTAPTGTFHVNFYALPYK